MPLAAKTFSTSSYAPESARPGGTVLGAQNFVNEVDWIAIALTDRETYQISLSSGDFSGILDSYLALCDSSGNPIGTRDGQRDRNHVLGGQYRN